ncbi:hypothetical protein JX265_004963 [Neoarthrinium moseri]|uniref:Uncharacterized protein n=1 Tax=Neoarthrinium moseri TaxID=1658444 RepID=A0A9Q0ARH1_9PEZI|nr:hypothetical protein JX265_004963 [Neoarthrinium moseri]
MTALQCYPATGYLPFTLTCNSYAGRDLYDPYQSWPRSCGTERTSTDAYAPTRVRLGLDSQFAGAGDKGGPRIGDMAPHVFMVFGSPAHTLTSIPSKPQAPTNGGGGGSAVLTLLTITGVVFRLGSAHVYGGYETTGRCRRPRMPRVDPMRWPRCATRSLPGGYDTSVQQEGA